MRDGQGNMFARLPGCWVFLRVLGDIRHRGTTLPDSGMSGRSQGEHQDVRRSEPSWLTAYDITHWPSCCVGYQLIAL